MVETGTKRISQRKGRPFVFEEQSGCIVCVSHPPNIDGYVRVYAGKYEYPRLQFLHRLVYKENVGDIPEGYEVDHMCRNRRCCNTAHLQLLTVSDHKAKTNKERYSDRIESVKDAIKSGKSTKEIQETFGVPREYVYRYRRKLKENI